MVEKTALQDEGINILFKLIHHLKTPLSTIRMAVSNIRYLMYEHVEQPEIREEYEDILLDTDKSIEDITFTITTIQALLNHNKQVEKVFELSELIADLESRIIKQGLSVRIMRGEILQAEIKWRGFDLSHVLFSLIRYFPKTNDALVSLSVQRCEPTETSRSAGIYLRFRITAEGNFNYADSTIHFEDNLGVLIARLILEQMDIQLHYNISAQSVNIYFEIPAIE